MVTATEARAAIRAGTLRAEDLVAACLRRIALRDREVRAWLAVSGTALAEARAITAEDRRPLAGIPVAVKDVFDTADLPTTHNSPLYAGHRPGADAPAVTLLRAAGAIILGKTDTTEFAAAGRNAATSHPMDPARSPGGSSAGSAAAVADGHVPLALATQTGGSTIRPGSFCGIPAFKPSWGLVSTEGVKRYAVSFDTVGWYARSVADLSLMAGVLGIAPGVAPAAPRIAVVRPHAALLAPESVAALDRATLALRAVAEVTEPPLPPWLEEIDALHRLILWTEGAAAFRNLVQSAPDLLHDDFHARVGLRGGQTPRAMFEAQDRLTDLRRAYEDWAQGYDAVLAPSAPGYAPLGHIPGDPVFNALWTALQVPVVNLPAAGPADPLPIGVSLIGTRAGDGGLLALAETLAPLLQTTA